MKRNIFLILFIFIILSCKYRKHFYDIDGPVFEFYTLVDYDILFQFNEPIERIKFNLNGKSENYKYEIDNIFPVANIRVPCDFFNSKNEDKLNIEAIDTSGNHSLLAISPPVINNNPILIQIEEINIKYTKKRQQKIVLKALTSGDISGYSLILFIRNRKVIIPFLKEEIEKGEKFYILIDSSKDEYNENFKLSFREKKVNLIFKYRLSQIYSLIYILDNKNKILDYFYYYDLKKNTLDYYMKNKNFNNMKSELLSYNIVPDIFDISETTSKKSVIKNGNNFIIKK